MSHSLGYSREISTSRILLLAIPLTLIPSKFEYWWSFSFSRSLFNTSIIPGLWLLVSNIK